jgi:hypothetical protein
MDRLALVDARHQRQHDVTAAKCMRCGHRGARLDTESGHTIHGHCLREWWAEVEPNIPAWMGVRKVESFRDADEAELRARGVLT